jgi:hypothetical protein
VEIVRLAGAGCASSTVIENCFKTAAPELSRTWIVKMKTPLDAGVPLITPFTPSSVRPTGI